MKSLLVSELHWVALAIGILVLIVGLSVVVWPQLRDKGDGSVLKANESIGLESEGGPLGLPARLSAGDEEHRSVMDSLSGNTVSDSTDSEVRTAEFPATHGGSGDVASVQDTAELVVRDAKGNIKRQEIVK